jgi:hypothetical protein
MEMHFQELIFPMDYEKPILGWFNVMVTQIDNIGINELIGPIIGNIDC